MILRGTIYDFEQVSETFLSVTITFRTKPRRYGNKWRGGKQQFLNIGLFGDLAERAMLGADLLDKGDKVRFEVELGGKLLDSGRVFNNLHAIDYTILEKGSKTIFDNIGAKATA